MRRVPPRFSPRYLVAPGAVAAVWIVFGAIDPHFPSLDNALNISGQFGALAVVALGEMLVIVTRGFDISVGSVAALASVAGAICAATFGTPGLAAAPLVGALCGSINGVLVAYFAVQPIVTTLGMLLFARGLALLLSGGNQAVPLPSDIDLSSIGYGDILAIPVIALVVAALTIATRLLATRLRIGRRLYMVGSNPQAAELVGVPTGPTLVTAYGLCGLLAGVAALFFLGRSGAGLATEGAGLELQAIASAVIGGTALTGGVGVPFLVVCGAFFIQSLLNGLNLLGISPFIAELVLGMVIVAAGLLDFAIRRLGAARLALNPGRLS